MRGTRVEKPWGAYEILEERLGHKVKRIEVCSGHRLSSQKHSRRSEHWFVVAGQAIVEVDADQVELSPGEAIDIPVGSTHRVANEAAETLVFIEIQTGDYFGEDDIVRLDDDYGRVAG